MARNDERNMPAETDGMPPFWPPRVVWAREKGWLDVRDPWTGEWFQIPSRHAPTGWVRLAMQARDPRKIVAEAAAAELYKDLRNGEIERNSDGLYARRLPGYVD